MPHWWAVCCMGWLLLLCNATPESPELITPHNACLGKEYTVGSGNNHKLKMWVSDQLHSITFLYVISWFPYISPSTQMYSLQTWRTFVSTIGGAIVVQENVPANEDKIPGRRYGFRADFRKDGGKLSHWLVQAVEQLGVQSGHPELKHAPLIMWGFSREGMHPPSFGEVYPNRLLGGIRYTSHLRDDVFDYGGTLNRIPFFLTIGEQDNIAKMNNINFLRNGRQYGTPWSCTLIHDAKHGDGYYDERATVFQFPWFLEVLSQIPDNLLKSTYRAPVALQRPKSQSQGSLNGNPFNVAPFQAFTHNISSASWLHSRTLAAVWKEVNEANALTQIQSHRTHPVALVPGPPLPGALAMVLVVRTRAEHHQRIALATNGTAVVDRDYCPLPKEV